MSKQKPRQQSKQQLEGEQNLYSNNNLLTLSEAAKDSPYSAEYLSLLARKNKLRCIKKGKVWHTTNACKERPNILLFSGADPFVKNVLMKIIF